VLEIGLLVDTHLRGSAITATCGKEAFGREAAVKAVFQKIKDAGGVIDIIRMDEPFFYGTVSCHDTAPNVAADVKQSIDTIVKPYFPQVRIGDVEPIYGRPDEPQIIAQWSDDFRAAVGTPLAFFHADAAWSSGATIDSMRRIDPVVHKRGIPFGIIYNGGDETTDIAWTDSAIQHFTELESGLGVHVDQPVFQSWVASPTNMLPEHSRGTLTNVAFQYVLPATTLLASRSAGGPVMLHLADSRTHAPIAGAAVTADVVDATNAWHSLTPRTVEGRTPANTAYAIIGLRANAEGVTATFGGEADLGTITFRFTDASAGPQSWRSSYATPRKIRLSPTTKLIENLPDAPSRCGGNAAIPVAPDSPFALSAPMSATASADHAGYVTAVFLDNQCHGLSRAYLYFTPSSRILSGPPTDVHGESRLELPPNLRAAPSELHLSYGGDNATHRPSMAIVHLE
jgi:hypothetical protein